MPAHIAPSGTRGFPLPHTVLEQQSSLLSSHGIQVGGTCRLTAVWIHVFLELLMCSHFPCAYGLLRPLRFYKSQAQLMYKKSSQVIHKDLKE